MRRACGDANSSDFLLQHPTDGCLDFRCCFRAHEGVKVFRVDPCAKILAQNRQFLVEIVESLSNNFLITKSGPEEDQLT